MKYEFYSTQEFIKELKTLSKKYKSLKDDLKKLQEEFVANPNLGISLGDGLRKIRLNITSKNTGKSGGARVISHELLIEVGTTDETKSVAFISIYDKSEYDTADLDIIKKIVKNFRETQQPTATKKTKNNKLTTND
ncbi:toxin [Capnocytophaga leadbetteri]|uniref:toxin n=1 Tax=Capnocytophaga leadbetteri TaxID=327575 RepID=UPI0028E43684|nr:toxin [Capnocytophaga leadbetteri]